MIIEHKYLFQITRILGRMVTPISLSSGHPGRQAAQAHHSHPSYYGHHGLHWLLDIMVIHKTMHIIRIT